MTQSTYGAASLVAPRIREHFAALVERRGGGRSALPSTDTIEAMLDAVFWASLRREEGSVPKISLAYLSPEIGRAPV